jgi:isopentenyldiphosphate isomerase
MVIISKPIINNMPKKCPVNKIVNPRTGRCVKKDGAIGRKLRGVAKKYMDTPALRKAIAKEKAKKKVKKKVAKNIKIPSFTKYYDQANTVTHFVYRAWEGFRDTFEEELIYDMSETKARDKADRMARKELRIKYNEVKKKKYKSMKEFEEAYRKKLKK